MKARTVLVCPDTHEEPDGVGEGGIDPAAESVLMQAIGIVKPDEFVHLGDVGEWSSASHWRWEKRKRPPFEYIEPAVLADQAAVRGLMDRLDRALDRVGCDKRTLIEGNHEVWLDQLAEEEHRRELKARIVLEVDKRGWGWSPYGEFHKVGKLWMTHGGHFTGLHHAHKTVMGLGASCMYGHFHNVESAHVMRLGGAVGAWSIGCLCKLKKKFLKGRPTNWSHAFGIVHVEADGRFHVEVVDIFEGVGYVYGRKVEAR